VNTTHKWLIDHANAVINETHNRMLFEPRTMDTRLLLTVLGSVMYDIRNGNESLRPVLNAGLKEYSIRRRASQKAYRKMLNR
jgi:hypothetical protein